MESYWKIALEDYELAVFCKSHEKFRGAVFHFQQFAEKGAKHLLEQIHPKHKVLRVHNIDLILEAYNNTEEMSELISKGSYLTSFYFNTRYPGDNYIDEINKVQVERAEEYANCLKSYYEAEIRMFEEKVDTAPVLEPFDDFEH